MYMFCLKDIFIKVLFKLFFVYDNSDCVAVNADSVTTRKSCTTSKSNFVITRVFLERHVTYSFKNT